MTLGLVGLRPGPGFSDAPVGPTAAGAPTRAPVLAGTPG